MNKANLMLFLTDWETSCDYCKFQEGRHYCILHSTHIKNMDMLKCVEWENRFNDKLNVMRTIKKHEY